MNRLVIGLLVVAAVLLVISGILWGKLKSSDEKWKVAEANVKAYSNRFTEEGKKSTALQLTVNQFKYFNDSILEALDKTRMELKIKDKNLKALQAVSSTFSKTDTIYHTDTLFREPSLELDTLLGDRWYTLRLGLKYPSMVAVKPEFKSDKHIVVSSKKETVNPPKKFFLFRWFQKKHWVLHVDVVEHNPYVTGQNSEFVEILK